MLFKIRIFLQQVNMWLEFQVKEKFLNSIKKTTVIEPVLRLKGGSEEIRIIEFLENESGVPPHMRFAILHPQILTPGFHYQ